MHMPIISETIIQYSTVITKAQPSLSLVVTAYSYQLLITLFRTYYLCLE